MSDQQPAQHPRPLLARLQYASTALAAAVLLSACASSSDALFSPANLDAGGLVFAPKAVYPGSTATVRGFGFKQDQQIHLNNGGQPLLKTPVEVGDKGGFSAEFAVPANAQPGIYPVVVQASKPSAAQVFEFTISAPVTLAGAEQFDVATQHLRPGLYQSAYSTRSGAAFVAASDGRPPKQRSALMRVDPQTLQITQEVGPGQPGANGEITTFAVFGVAVDDAAATVWTTNTTGDAVAVYRQDDLALIKQFPKGTVEHAREIAIDSVRHRAYVSTGTAPVVAVIDTQALKPVGQIELKSPKRRSREQPASMGLALDAAQGKLYAASRTTNEIYEIDLATQAVTRVIDLPDARGASGVAVAPEQGLLFVASQGSDSLHIINLRDGSVKQRVTVGAGPLSVAWEPTQQLAYVASRGSDSIAVVDTSGEIVAQLDGGSYPNYVFTDGKGQVFALNKARGRDDKNGDFIRRIRHK